jgi:murein DD-endopeptidase MepM/ murein hydrolase activator NlpD
MTWKWIGKRESSDPSQQDRRPRFRFIRWLPAVLLLSAGGLGVPSMLEFLRGLSEPIVAENADEAAPTPEEAPVVESGEIESGESFYDLMKKFGTEDAEILSMTQAARPVFDLKRIMAGRSYRVAMRGEKNPVGFEYEIDDGRQLVLSGLIGNWTARIDPIEYQMRERVVRGVIEDSLYLSLVDACQSTVLAVNLADIFAWDIDFALDLRKGDAYGILYQERWRDDRYIGPGRILAAQVINRGETYSAVYYDGDPGGDDYYDSDGRSLQKQFLKSPLRFKYISSYFSKNRLHPILKIHRPHLGVDYAAPYGTPVRASADGRVIYKGRNGGMGQMIKIRHNRIYTTAYGHLSRYARHLKVGKSVRQGEIIGYVGSTGLSTGPHLHYSFYKYGRLINPMREENPRAKSVPSPKLARFEALAHKRLERVRPPEYDKVTASVNRPGT